MLTRSAMAMRRSTFVYACVVGASISIFAFGAHFAATALIDSQRTKELHELNEATMRQSEVAIAYGAITLDEIASRDKISCDAAALQLVRLRVYQRGAIKDIRVVDRDGSVICSAYPETLEFDKGWVKRSDMMPARDDNVLLFKIEQFFGTAVGVLKDIDENTSLVVIISINPYLLDIMPTELRQSSSVTLQLTDGQEVARYPPSEQNSTQSEPFLSFSSESNRFPLRSNIRVNTQTLSQWHREYYAPIVAIVAVIGAAFGVLLANVVTRPPSPVTELDRALAAQEIKPYFQPLFDLRTGEILGCEVLARWICNDGTVIPPSRFIPLAESSGRIERMTWQLTAMAISQLRPLLRQNKRFKLSINVVAHHLLAPGFVRELRQLVAGAKASPRQIVLELTEREEISDLAGAAAVIGELRERGFSVAIDDVGTGHSGLSQIQRLGANILKADKFFVDAIARDQSAVTVIKMLVQLANDLNMQLLAEGIETEEQRSALIACGIEHGQGYIVSPPLNAADFIDLVLCDWKRTGADGTAQAEIQAA
jgi:sensor c-di-GMP phosphodiesterase-like protein